MSLSSLFKSGLSDVNSSTNSYGVVGTVPVANLFSMKLDRAPSKPEAPKVKPVPKVEEKPKEIIVEKIVEVVVEKIVEKVVEVEKVVRDDAALLKSQSELEQVKALNTKYLHVINKINEELMTLKLNESKNSTPVVVEKVVEKVVRDDAALLKSQAELEQVKLMNSKYLQVINHSNEELMTARSNEGKNAAAVVSISKERDELSSKVEELTKALLNVISQNKLLSRALGLRS